MMVSILGTEPKVLKGQSAVQEYLKLLREHVTNKFLPIFRHKSNQR